VVLLFASSEPLTQARLVELLERPAPARVAAALEALRAELESSELPLVLQKVAGAWRILSDPEFAHVVNRLRAEPKPERISAAALETLAIIAYRQPVSKAEIEAIRGVQAGPVLRSLVDRGLVRIAGRADLPGAPLLYGTTKEFLERFGLAALKDLPRDGELNED
jgi:segregation and condensation protein B